MFQGFSLWRRVRDLNYRYTTFLCFSVLYGFYKSRCITSVFASCVLICFTVCCGNCGIYCGMKYRSACRKQSGGWISQCDSCHGCNLIIPRFDRISKRRGQQVSRFVSLCSMFMVKTGVFCAHFAPTLRPPQRNGLLCFFVRILSAFCLNLGGVI